MGQTAGPFPGLDSEGLLRAWERGAASAPELRGVAVLSAADPRLAGRAEQLPVGSRDTLLLALRVGTFGAALQGVSECPECRDPVDVDTDCSAILAQLPEPELDPAPPDPVEIDGWQLSFRLPDSLDLAVAARCADRAAARQALIGRCFETVRREGRERSVAELPEHVVSAVAERMEQADPASEIRLRTRCPSCGHEWTAALDIAEFLWSELSAAAVGLLHEVDVLAARYGWAERDILAMTPARRAAYLDLV